MNDTPRHELDEAIDRVAAKMVAVDDDGGALQAVLSRLPEREPQQWFLRMPVQAAAAVALVLVAFVWAPPVEQSASPVAVAPIAAVAPPLVAARMLEPASRLASERIPDPGPRIPDSGSRIPEDHERSLEPLAPLATLEVPSIAPEALEPAAPGVLAPLVLTELPLAGEFTPPREP